MKIKCLKYDFFIDRAAARKERNYWLPTGLHNRRRSLLFFGQRLETGWSAVSTVTIHQLSNEVSRWPFRQSH